MTGIRYWDRKHQREETERVYGDAGVRFLYENVFGQRLADGVLSRRLPSKLYGWYQGSRLSRHKIASFIRGYEIQMSEFVEEDFGSFNEFFVRRFKPGARAFDQDPGRMPAFAEARYLAYDRITADQTFPVKGAHLSPVVLLGRPDLARAFQDGSLLIARLCPLDYHRFHYPDDGRTWDSYRVHGKLHSVNPLALKYRSEIFFTNERQISILHTRHFGRIAYVEVGAMAVGKIVQTHLQAEFKRGEEKGYFLFGASTVIVMGEAGAWKPDADLLEMTARKTETLVRLGEGIANSAKR